MVETAPGVAHAAGIAVVEEERVAAQASGIDHRADILLVTHDIDGRHLHQHVGDADERLADEHLPLLHLAHQLRRRGAPEGDGFQLLRRQFQLLEAQAVAGVEADLFEHRDSGGDRDIAKPHLRPAPGALLFPCIDANLRHLHRLRVVVQLAALHEGDLLLQVELRHEIGLRPVQIDGVRVQLRQRAHLVHRADDMRRPAAGVLNGVDHPAHIAQIDLSGGEARLRPIPALVDGFQGAILFQ